MRKLLLILAPAFAVCACAPYVVIKRAAPLTFDQDHLLVVQGENIYWDGQGHKVAEDPQSRNFLAYDIFPHVGNIQNFAFWMTVSFRQARA